MLLFGDSLKKAGEHYGFIHDVPAKFAYAKMLADYWDHLGITRHAGHAGFHTDPPAQVSSSDLTRQAGRAG